LLFYISSIIKYLFVVYLTALLAAQTRHVGSSGRFVNNGLGRTWRKLPWPNCLLFVTAYTL